MFSSESTWNISGIFLQWNGEIWEEKSKVLKRRSYLLIILKRGWNIVKKSELCVPVKTEENVKILFIFRNYGIFVKDNDYMIVFCR